MNAAPAVDAAVPPAFEVKPRGSNTLQSRHFADTQDLRARLIEATVQAFAEGNGPRLQRSRL